MSDRPQAGSIEQRGAAAASLDAGRLTSLIPYGVESRDLGGWREVIEPGALDDADLSDLLACVEHRDDRILGRYPTTLALTDTAAGMRWACELPATRDGEEVRTLVQRGDLAASSWRMVVARDRWQGDVRHVEKIARLIDVGPVSRAAYGDAAPVELRAYTPETTTGGPPMPQTTAAPAAPTTDVDAPGNLAAAEAELEAPAAVEPRSMPHRPTLRLGQAPATDDTARPISERVIEAMRAIPAGECRALTAATSAAPVTPPEQSTYVWDNLRPASAFLATGVQTIRTARSSVKLPLVNADMTAAFYGELDAITESDPGLGELEIKPAKIAALVRGSSEAFDDSSPDLLTLLQDHLHGVLARRLDLACIAGTGTSGTIKGLLHLSGTLAVDGSTGGWDGILDAAAVLRARGADGKLAVLLHPFSQLALSKIRAGSTSEHLYAPIPEGVPPVFVSSAIPVADGAAPAIVLDTSRVAVVQRQDATVEVDRSQEFTSDAVLVRGKVRAGLAVPHPAAVAIVTGLAAPDPTD